jgi:putative endonuclease
MKQKNYETGKLGEKLAEEFLNKNGYRIIERNFHTRFGELDLIATKNGKLIFIEVKLKIGDDFGTPEEMITPTKLRQVTKTAESFLLMKPEIRKVYDSYQVDAVCIVLTHDREIERINHYENLTF